MDTKASISNHHRDCLYRQSNVKHARAFQECPTTWNPTRLNSFLMSNPDPWSTQPMGFTGRSSSNVLVQKCNSPDSCDKRKEKRKQISFRGEKKNPNSRKLKRAQTLCPPVNTWDGWIAFVQVDNMQRIETRNKKGTDGLRAWWVSQVWTPTGQ